MTTRRKFLTIGGAVAAGVALFGWETKAFSKVKIDGVGVTPYVRPGTYIAPKYQYVFLVNTISEFLAFLLAADMYAPKTKMSVEFSPSGFYQITVNDTYLSPREYEFIRKAAKKLVRDERSTVLHKLTSRLTSWKNHVLVRWRERS